MSGRSRLSQVSRLGSRLRMPLTLNVAIFMVFRSEDHDALRIVANPEFCLGEGHCGGNFGSQCANLFADGFAILGGGSLEQDADHEGPLLVDAFAVERTVHLIDRESVDRNRLPHAL